jgi:hypothetical protein
MERTRRPTACGQYPLKLPVYEPGAVRAMPGSGTPAELLHAAGIDADAIVSTVKVLLGRG